MELAALQEPVPLAFEKGVPVGEVPGAERDVTTSALLHNSICQGFTW